MSGENLDDMTPEQIDQYVLEQRAKSREAFKGQPLPEFSRVKRDDHPHWKPAGFFFQTAEGTRVLIDRGDGERIEGTVRGVRTVTRGQDSVIVDFDGEWACARADESGWALVMQGLFLPGKVFTLLTRVRFKDLGVTVVEEFDPDGDQPETRDLQDLGVEC